MAGVSPLLPDDPKRLGRYELVGRLGEGGQSVVYLGRHDNGGQAAVKLLRAQFSRDPEWRARFERELAMIGRVAGFCTAQVIDADISGDLPYVVSEYVPGPSLSGLVSEQGPRRGTDLDRLAIGTVTALAAIHRAGILHRDFKPSNVLMGPDGPRVIDFGIARVIGASSARGSGLLGTPSYMAPEQVSGGELGTGVDMFTWASTMLFAATGRHPFGNDTISAVFNRILHQEPDLSPLPETLRGVVAACLAKDPAARPDAQQVLLTLLGGEVQEGQGEEGTLTTGANFARTPPPPTVARPPQAATTDSGGTSPLTPQRTVPPRSRRRVLGIVAAVTAPLLALAAGGAAWALLADGSSRDPAQAGTGRAAPPATAVMALEPAKRAIETVLSFDHATLDENVEAAHRASTSRFRSDYDRVLAPRSYREKLKDRKGSVTAEVTESAVVAATSDQVTVLSYVERTVRAENADPNRLRDPMRATLIRQNGSWLLDSLYSLKANSTRANTAGASWPGPQAREALEAATRDASASGEFRKPVEAGLAPAERADRLIALVTVGECRGGCTDEDPVVVQRLTLRRVGGGWTVISAGRL
ncbi:MAG TPA: serine/threonine-protein kinase [Spirillospora sp.]